MVPGGGGRGRRWDTVTKNKGELHHADKHQGKTLPQAAGLHPRGDPLSVGAQQGVQAHEAQRHPPPLSGGQKYRAAV